MRYCLIPAAATPPPTGFQMTSKFVAVTGILVLSVLVSCGRSNDPRAAAEARIFKLAQMNGCIDCHTVSTGSVGPSWMAVAARYKDAPRANARALLIASVMNGSQGKWMTWGAAYGMPPLGRRVPRQDIEQLVDYILSLHK